MRSLHAAEAEPASALERAPVALDENGEEADSFDTGSRWANIAWAGLGFVCGAVFWHAVGFWSFLGSVMSHGPAIQAAVEAGDCITLVLVRDTGTTRSEPCPELIARLPDDKRNYRGPLLTAELRRARLPASRWEITISNEPAPDADPGEER